MSALEKDPAARPQSAVAFADAIRANADGLGALYRRAFALYSQHFPTVLKLSLVAHVPVFLVLVVTLGMRLGAPDLFEHGRAIAETALGILRGVATWLTASCISGTIVILVTQLSGAPLREVRFRTAFAILWKRWRPFARTGLRVTLRIMLGFVALVIPGLAMIARYLLWAPVVLMEGLEGKSALKRAAALASRSRRDIVMATLFQLGVPALAQKWLEMLIGYDVKVREGNGVELISQFASLASVLVLPLVSIVPALLYLKMRQFGGETLSEVAGPVEAPADRRQWEIRMRERPSMPSTRKADRAVQRRAE